MNFEIDVSGEDILNRDYTIVVADKNDIIRGFKFDSSLIQILRARYGQGKYRYSVSAAGKSLFRVRLYCIIVFYLFKSIEFKDKEINLEICRDFQGHENDITSNLRFFLEQKLGLKINIVYGRLPRESNADKYAFLMRKDSKNQIKGYVGINLEDIEKFLEK